MKDTFENETQENLFRLVHRLRSLVVEELRQVDDRISVMHIRSLKFISRHEPVTQQDLVQDLKRDKGQIARLVNDLVEFDLLAKQPDKSDRRSASLSLTAAAKKLLAEYQKKEQKKFNLMLKGMDKEQIKLINNSLKIMSDNLG